MTTSDKIVTIRAKAFAGQGIQEHRCSVDDDGTVRVWDSVAGHYTICHSLGQSAQRRARKLAKEGLADGTICQSCGKDPMLCECVTEYSRD